MDRPSIIVHPITLTYLHDDREGFVAVSGGWQSTNYYSGAKQRDEILETLVRLLTAERYSLAHMVKTVNTTGSQPCTQTTYLYIRDLPESD